MKLGVSFNVFSGADLLKPAIINASHFANHIVCVYSDVSNTGNPAPKYLLPLLQDLLKEGYINEIIQHKPQVSSSLGRMVKNNMEKRVLGQRACQKAGCTHYMSRDCDEFYNVEQFKNMLENLSQFDFTVCGIYEYAISPKRMNPTLSELHVPVIHKIQLVYKYLNTIPVLLDKERTVHPISSYYICKPEELVMHHMREVRYNSEEYKRKLHGHPHLIRLKTDPKTFEQSLRQQNEIYSKEVEDQFGILDYWEKEFCKYI